MAATSITAACWRPRCYLERIAVIEKPLGKQHSPSSSRSFDKFNSIYLGTPITKSDRLGGRCRLEDKRRNKLFQVNSGILDFLSKEKADDVEDIGKDGIAGKSEVKEETEERKLQISKLVLSIGVDLIGILAGKHILQFDFGWAPVSAFIIQRMYRAPLLSSVSFIEQAIPGIDFVPTATLGWAVETFPELEWVTKIPFMGGLGKTKQSSWWPFGKKKDD